MPVLKNAKHERFAQEVAKGQSADEAAFVAGIELRSCVNRLRYYVYLLIDPRTGAVFYVGKGKNNRAFAHVREWQAGQVVNAKKFNTIGDIVRAGLSVKHLCLIDDLSESDAFDTEYWLINAIGRDRLTNLSSGEQSEEVRLAAMVRDHLKRIRPFCRWKLGILSQFEAKDHDWMERAYWDIIGNMSEDLANLEARA